VKRQFRGFLQLTFLFVVVYILIRLFPIATRIANAAALGVRELWWVVLIFALGAWLIWVLKKRNSD